jgi:3-methyladenine DNA glycosylase AlkD
MPAPPALPTVGAPSSTPTATAAQNALSSLSQPDKAQFFARFFKSGKGQYGEGDRFLGVTVPQVRMVAKRFAILPIADCVSLLHSPLNEVRLLVLLVLVARYKKGDLATRQEVYDVYLSHRQWVNNWNLVDSSAPCIVGAHLIGRDREVLYQLAQSPVLWDRRIAVLATFALIRENDYRDVLALCELLLGDTQDLMHKACGWMLREVGKRDAAVLERFLRKHQRSMPRTMLRYAVERCSPEVRRAAMDGKL